MARPTIAELKEQADLVQITAFNLKQMAEKIGVAEKLQGDMENLHVQAHSIATEVEERYTVALGQD